MYELFFGLSRRPFSATPDPECCAAVTTMQTAFDDLHRCLTRGDGVGILTGGSGSGKTLLCQKMVADLADAFRPVYLANSNFPTQRSLLQAILYALGRPYLRLDEQELRLELTTIVHEVASQANGVLLIVDEAHLLGEELLEEIRTATNLIHRGVPLVRVMLSGQFELEEKLAAPALESLNQRVGTHASLEPISRQESVDYIGFRLEWAGTDVRQTFTPDAVQMIAQVSDGNPRCLNQLADHCLLLAYAAEERPVLAATVRRALEDLRHLPLQWNISESQMRGDEPLEFEMEAPMEQLPDARRPERAAPAIREAHTTSVVEFGESSVIEIGGPEPQHDRGTTEPQESVIEIGGDAFEQACAEIESAECEIAENEPQAVRETTRTEAPARGGRFGSRATTGKKPADRSLEVFDVSAFPSARSIDIDSEATRDSETEKMPQPVASTAHVKDEVVVVDRYAKLDAENPWGSKAATKVAEKSSSKPAPGAGKQPVLDDSKSTQAAAKSAKPSRAAKRQIKVVDETDESSTPPVHEEIIASIERYMGELLRDRPSSTIRSTNEAIDALLTKVAPDIFAPVSGSGNPTLPVEYDVIQPEPADVGQASASQRAESRDDRTPRHKAAAPKEERYARLFSDLRKRRLG